jgi:hypothetical protein
MEKLGLIDLANDPACVDFRICFIYNSLINTESDVLVLHLIDRHRCLPLYVHLLRTFKCSQWKLMSQISKQDRQCMYKVTSRHFCESSLLWKSNKYYVVVCVCMCACSRAGGGVHACCIIHHATCMCHIVTSFVALLSVPYFLTLSDKWRDFRGGKKLLDMKCLL